MTLCGDLDTPSSEDLGERLRILVLRCSKFAHVNECRVFRVKDRKLEAGIVLEILYFASQRPERPHGLTLDVVHGISITAKRRDVIARVFGQNGRLVNIGDDVREAVSALRRDPRKRVC
jgi:hypothetical protein